MRVPEMLEITAEATKSMYDMFSGKEKSPVRISLLTGGCGIRFFSVAAADIRSNDERFDIDGFTFLVERKIIREYGPIKVDSDGFAFRLSGGGIHPPNACGTCAFGCGPRGKMHCDGVCRRCSSPCPAGRRILAKPSSMNNLVMSRPETERHKENPRNFDPLAPTKR